MKTAEQWVSDSEGKWDSDYIRAIQSDALNEAAISVGNNLMRYRRMDDWDCAHRAAFDFVRSQLAEMAVSVLINQPQNEKTKEQSCDS